MNQWAIFFGGKQSTNYFAVLSDISNLSAVDENGQWNKEVLLDIILRNAHERGNTDDFYVQCPGVLDIQKICLGRDACSTFSLDHWWGVTKLERCIETWIYFYSTFAMFKLLPCSLSMRQQSPIVDESSAPLFSLNCTAGTWRKLSLNHVQADPRSYFR